MSWIFRARLFSILFGLMFASSCARPNFLGCVHLSFDVEEAEPAAILPMLDALERNHVPASFFIRGEALAKLSDHGNAMLTAIQAHGHLLGNHSFSHPNFTKLSKEDIARELQNTELLLHNFITLRVIRPPFAADDLRVRTILRELGYLQVHWHVQAAEYAGWLQAYTTDPIPARERFLTYLVKKVKRKNGGILNLHDTPLITDNLDLLIQDFDHAGFHFVSLEYFLTTRSS